MLGDDGQHHHLGRVSELDAVEPFDPQVVGVRELGAQPLGELLAYVAHWAAASAESAGRRSTGDVSWVKEDMSIGRQFGYRGYAFPPIRISKIPQPLCPSSRSTSAGRSPSTCPRFRELVGVIAVPPEMKEWAPPPRSWYVHLDSGIP